MLNINELNNFWLRLFVAFPGMGHSSSSVPGLPQVRLGLS